MQILFSSLSPLFLLRTEKLLQLCQELRTMRQPFEFSRSTEPYGPLFRAKRGSGEGGKSAMLSGGHLRQTTCHTGRRTLSQPLVSPQ